MPDLINQSFNSDALHFAFVEQTTILYNAKTSLIVNLPRLIGQATFQNLKHALQEDLDDSKTQMGNLKEIFRLMGESWLTQECLGMSGVVEEAIQQVSFKKDNQYNNDLSILFYISVIENMQLGACKILNLLALKVAYQPYAQLLLQCLDFSRDNARLIDFVAEEYFA